jgi:hypothetical protein
VQSDSEIVLLPLLVAICGAAALMQTVLTKRRTTATHFCVLFGIAELSNINWYKSSQDTAQ